MENSAQNLLDFCLNCVSILPIMPIFILVIRATEAGFEFCIYWEISAVVSAALISYTGSRCNQWGCSEVIILYCLVLQWKKKTSSTETREMNSSLEGGTQHENLSANCLKRSLYVLQSSGHFLANFLHVDLVGVQYLNLTQREYNSCQNNNVHWWWRIYTHVL